jgi:hypothetical protein
VTALQPTKDRCLEEKLQKATGASVAELTHFAEDWSNVAVPGQAFGSVRTASCAGEEH